MGIERLSILGVGLLGGSLGLAVKKRISGCSVVGYGHRPQTLRRALELGAVDEAHSSVAQAVAGADLVVLATPVGLFDGLLRDLAPHLKPGAIVTDVGSTKRSVVKAAEAILPGTVHFVGSHPMAGSEKRGVEFASADLFQNAVCIVTPTTATNQAASAKVSGFWTQLGMRVTLTAPDMHDAMLARVSHLPHAVASALVTMQDELTVQLAGKGFLDATRIAGGDGALWRDILLDNRDNMKAAIDQLTRELQQLSAMLEPGRSDELTRWLDHAAQTRNTLTTKSEPRTK